MRWSESTWPVARAKTVSPSHIVCAGRMAESMPSWPASDKRCARSLDSLAFVATTTRVVLVPVDGGAAASGFGASPEGRRPSLRGPAPAQPPLRESGGHLVGSAFLSGVLPSVACPSLARVED